MAALQKHTTEFPPEDERSPQNGLQQFEQLQYQTIDTQDRLYWMLQLRDCFDHSTCAASNYKIMLTLAVRLSDWVMVIDIYQAAIKQNEIKQNEIKPHEKTTSSRPSSVKEKITLTLDCAEAYVQLGVPAQAMNLLREALFQHYQNSTLFSYYSWAQQKNTSIQKSKIPWQDCSSKELQLIPLESHHIDAFRWTYSKQSTGNNSVAELCNLPKFQSNDDWLKWLQDCGHYQNHYLYTVIHQEWGFIGSVCLEVFNGTGFFYYWLGEDFQGYGFGPQAIDILLTLGQKHKNMACCYAKVYDYNIPSQKALNKIGFIPLPIKLAAPHQNEHLYYFGPTKNQRQYHQELNTLFTDMESDMHLEITRDSLLGV